MSWFKKKPNFGFKIRRREAPDGLWLKCEGCAEILYARELERDARVCAKCGYHFKIGCYEYVALLTDDDSFVETNSGVISVDPLNFRDSKRYSDRLKDYRKKTQLSESVITGSARIAGHDIGIGVMDFAFMGGTLGSATGEKLRRLIMDCVERARPLVVVSTSGGARMQEGILSLMQMAKTSVALAALREAHMPYISILLNPTTAGVAASYASLGDVIIAEPGSQIGFAGPRVIQQTINQDLPEGFQTAEFVLDHGMIDMIVSRIAMRETVVRILRMFREPFVGVADVEPEVAAELVAEEIVEPVVDAQAPTAAELNGVPAAQLAADDGDGDGEAPREERSSRRKKRRAKRDAARESASKSE